MDSKYLAGVLLIAPILVLAGDLPRNSHSSVFGGGWECNRGYYKLRQECIKVVVPENASVDILGHGWVCNRGYYKSGDHCSRVIVPANASLNILGNGWECDRGYYRSREECIKVVLPEDAGIDILGHGWVCNRGYYRSGQHCVKVNVPDNASLNVLGNGWACNRGYFRSGQSCTRVIVPKNASIDVLGSGWICNKGYKRSNNSCVAMTQEELRRQKELAIAEKMKRQKMRGPTGDNCDTEFKTNAEVCIKIGNVSLDCNENIFGHYYDDCDVVLNYEVETNYSGGSYIDVEVECTVEIEYKGRQTYITQSDSGYQNESHSLYANDSDSETMSFNFSFGSFDEVTRAKISSARCEIESVDLQ